MGESVGVVHERTQIAFNRNEIGNQGLERFLQSQIPEKQENESPSPFNGFRRGSNFVFPQEPEQQSAPISQPIAPARRVELRAIPRQVVADQLKILETGDAIVKRERPLIALALSEPFAFIHYPRHGYRINDVFKTDSNEVTDAKALVRLIHGPFSETEKRFSFFMNQHSFRRKVEDYESFIVRGVDRCDEALRVVDAAPKLHFLDSNSDGVVTEAELANAPREAKREFSPREFAILTQRFEKLKANSNRNGVPTGLTQDSLETFAGNELLDPSFRLYWYKLNREQALPAQLKFSQRFAQYNDGWDANSDKRIEKRELQDAIRKTSGQEKLIAELALKHFEFLSYMSGAQDPLKRYWLQGRFIDNDGVDRLNSYAQSGRVGRRADKLQYQSVMFDLLRNQLIP